MIRTNGMMIDSELNVSQHLNPACRVARDLPALPVSRFLLSIIDNDVAFNTKNRVKFVYYFDYISLVFNFFLSNIPQSIKKLTGELLLAIIFYTIVLILINLYFVSIYIIIAIGVSIAIILIVNLLLKYRKQVIERNKYDEIGILRKITTRSNKKKKAFKSMKESKRLHHDQIDFDLDYFMDKKILTKPNAISNTTSSIRPHGFTKKKQNFSKLGMLRPLQTKSKTETYSADEFESKFDKENPLLFNVSHNPTTTQETLHVESIQFNDSNDNNGKTYFSLRKNRDILRNNMLKQNLKNLQLQTSNDLYDHYTEPQIITTSMQDISSNNLLPYNNRNNANNYSTAISNNMIHNEKDNFETSNRDEMTDLERIKHKEQLLKKIQLAKENEKIEKLMNFRQKKRNNRIIKSLNENNGPGSQSAIELLHNSIKIKNDVTKLMMYSGAAMPQIDILACFEDTEVGSPVKTGPGSRRPKVEN
jgi:hypothetical protein